MKSVVRSIVTLAALGLAGTVPLRHRRRRAAGAHRGEGARRAGAGPPTAWCR